jgi:hypothetical protein
LDENEAMPKFAVSICFALLLQVTPATAQDFDAAGRDKMAEWMAFIREAPEACPKVSAMWIGEALTLYVMMKEPVGEDAIVAKQKYLTALRAKIGWVNWCQLYAAEMMEADTIFGMVEQNAQ